MRAVRNRTPIVIPLSWATIINRITLNTIGVLLGALSVVLFFAPAEIAPVGLSGISVILNITFGTPIGVVFIILNIPVLYIAYRMLGGLQAVIWTLYVVILYSLAVDILIPYFPEEGITNDGLLNAVFAGTLSGMGGGLILRGNGTYGGTGTIARILQIRYGLPLSTTSLYSNLAVVGMAGAFLGWEAAMFSLVALIIEGNTTDYMLEGPSVIRTVTIITNHPWNVSSVILYQMQRGVSGWEVTGMYTGEKRHMLFVTISRPQVNWLQQLVLEVDPAAFIVIGQGHTAIGGGFKRKVPKSAPPAGTTEPEIPQTSQSDV
jgi:uncharacterized membrane-anchored protein YitT (DUF2179 family)